MLLRRCVLCILICALFGSGVFSAQSAGGDSTGAPRIGVALAGGGALGLAHIGVLQWMEEHRIPIYYVAGTSMGRVVGGIYSTGDSPAEIKAFTKRIDWDAV